MARAEGLRCEIRVAPQSCAALERAPAEAVDCRLRMHFSFGCARISTIIQGWADSNANAKYLDRR